MRVGAAVSGGADSVALLRTLLSRREALGLVLSVVHVHHGIRGEEAERDAAFVEALAAQHRLPIELQRVDTPARAAQHGETLEEAARHLRYGFFRELFDSGKLDAIATAHTLDDQAETVLQKMLRGGWTEGLSGIAPVLAEPRGKILRPILGTSHQSIEAYLAALNQPWCEDSTNRDLRHRRNRVRHELLPLLRDYNPQISAQLSRLATIARDEEEYWQREMARIGPGLVLPGRPVRGGGRSASTHPEAASIAMELERLRPLSPAVQRRLLRWAAQQLQCTLDFEHTEGLMLLCGFSSREGGSAGKRLDLNGEVAAQRTAREIQFMRKAETPALSAKLELKLNIPGELTVPELGLIFRTALKERAGAAGVEPAMIRYPRAGDRVTLRYSSGPKRIKDVLERRNLAAAERQTVPLVAWQGQVVWLQGIELEPMSMASPFNLEVVPLAFEPA